MLMQTDVEGNTTWQYDTLKAIHSTPAVVGSRLFAATFDGDVFSFNLSQEFNVTIWNATAENVIVNSTMVRNNTFKWKKSLGTRVEAGISATDEIVYVPGVDGKLYALHPDSGTVLSTFETNASIFAAPAIADGFVFLASTDGKLYALSRP